MLTLVVLLPLLLAAVLFLGRRAFVPLGFWHRVLGMLLRLLLALAAVLLLAALLFSQA